MNIDDHYLRVDFLGYCKIIRKISVTEQCHPVARMQNYTQLCKQIFSNVRTGKQRWTIWNVQNVLPVSESSIPLGRASCGSTSTVQSGPVSVDNQRVRLFQAEACLVFVEQDGEWVDVHGVVKVDLLRSRVLQLRHRDRLPNWTRNISKGSVNTALRTLCNISAVFLSHFFTAKQVKQTQTSKQNV